VAIPKGSLLKGLHRDQLKKILFRLIGKEGYKHQRESKLSKVNTRLGQRFFCVKVKTLWELFTGEVDGSLHRGGCASEATGKPIFRVGRRIPPFPSIVTGKVAADTVKQGESEGLVSPIRGAALFFVEFPQTRWESQRTLFSSSRKPSHWDSGIDTPKGKQRAFPARNKAKEGRTWP